MKKLALMAGAAALLAGQAVASEGFYAGIQYSNNTVKEKEDGVSVSVDLGVLGVLAGYQFHENFALEGRFGTGVKDKKWREDGYSDTFSAGNSYGLYAKGIVPLSQEFSLYGVAGYAHTKYKWKEVGQGWSDQGSFSSKGLSYGVGGEFAFSPQLSVTLEYVHLPTKKLQEDGWEFKLRSSNVALGVNYRF
mgnify:CR=1 FL=1